MQREIIHNIDSILSITFKFKSPYLPTIDVPLYEILGLNKMYYMTIGYHVPYTE